MSLVDFCIDELSRLLENDIRLTNAIQTSAGV
jgi:hypothetical protein